MLAVLLQLSFCSLPSCIIISSVHGTFSFSNNEHAQELLVRRSYERFDTGIVILERFSAGP